MNSAEQDQTSKPQRRKLGYAVAALAAGLAGAGLGWWRYTPAALEPGSDLQLWSLEFETPGGTRLALQSLRGRPLLINFWATWCAPCIEELPLLDAFYRENAPDGWQILGIALDTRKPVQAFLQRQPLAFAVVLAGMEGLNLSLSLGNEARGLPFSVLIDARSKLLARKIGKLSASDLKLWRQLAGRS